MSLYAIGLDFGTLSARAILVDIHTGVTAAEAVSAYRHGVMDTALPNGHPLPEGFALQDPRDYLESMQEAVRGVMEKSRVLPAQIVGIGIDFTSATILPADDKGMPLCMHEAFADEPHAYVKLWKHHGAEAEAQYIGRIAHKRNEAWLSSHGGKVSGEWTFPKILETLHHAPEVYEHTRYFLEAMDWLVWILTGKVSASLCGVGYKMFCHQGHFPDESFLQALDPRLGNFLKEKFPQDILPIGSCAGYLTPETAEQLGLSAGIPVGTPIIDAHSSLPGCGIHTPGEMMIIMGTSSCHMLLTDRYAEIRGIQGIVKDGILPGYWGIEAGQPCTGDLLAWTVSTCMTPEYTAEAERRGISGHELLTEKLHGYKAGKSGLLALDWFNGVRTPLMDFDLSGMLMGMTLLTKPEDIYLSMIEAGAYGTRLIIEEFEAAGVPVNRIVLGGGIPARNALVRQVYADVLNRPVSLSGNTQASAGGAAYLGIAAAPEEVTGYHDIFEIITALAPADTQVYTPDPAQAEIYEKLYAEYRKLQQYFGEGGNSVMHTLADMRRR